METAPIQIRSAQAIDNSLLAELGARTFADTFAAENTPENMAAYLAESFNPLKQAEELADPLSIFLIAEVESQPVGFTHMSLAKAPECISGLRPIEIVRIYSVKEWIGYGVGAALMRACLAEAAQHQCDTIWLDVWERNPRARAFYHKWGFREAGKAIFKLGDDLQHDLLLQRPVDIAGDIEDRKP
jgi:diamine N-acetyltransferase